jgi:hypothetical protein
MLLSSSTPRSELGFCEPLKTWVAPAGESTWQRDGDRIASLAAQLLVAGQVTKAGHPVFDSEQAELLRKEMEKEGIAVLSGATGSLLQQQCNSLLFAEPHLCAEAFYRWWKKQPWREPPAQVRAAKPGRFDVAAVEQILGYKFSNPHLPLCALTHSSYTKVWTSDAPNPKGGNLS